MDVASTCLALGVVALVIFVLNLVYDPKRPKAFSTENWDNGRATVTSPAPTRTI